MNVRPLSPGEIDAAGRLLYEAYSREAQEAGAPSEIATEDEGRRRLRQAQAEEPAGVLGVEEGGALIGVGAVTRRGETATITALAVALPGHGAGAALLDNLITVTDAWGCASIRAWHPSWHAPAFALLAGRGFSVVDVGAHMVREAAEPPRIDAARGLEIGPPGPADFPEVLEMDRRLTGLERGPELERTVRFVARRRGQLCAFVGRGEGTLGPGLAVDVADLGAVLARALSDVPGPVSLRVSTATPPAVLAALGLGFRVVSLGTIMNRGIHPPARPAQLY